MVSLVFVVWQENATFVAEIKVKRNSMDVFLLILSVVLGVVGLIGAVLPIIPGTILSYVGLLCVALIESSTIGVEYLIVWGIVVVAVLLSDYFLPGYFSKVCGGTKAGITGATIGAIAGALFMNVLGLVLGPLVGAVIGEMLGGKLPLGKAVVVGLGALMAFFVGTGIKLLVGVWMLCKIIIEAVNLSGFLD